MTYLIKYTVLDRDENPIKTGSVRAHNKNSSIEAQVKLEAFLRKKHKNFHRLIVHSCTEESPIEDSPIMSIFNDIFGNNKT